MSALRLISLSALVGALAACSPAAEPEDSSAAQPAAPQVEAPAAETVAAPTTGPNGETLDALEILAREVCAAGDEGFAELLPDGAGFASRGADARVHTAWNLDGETAEQVIYTPELELDDRTAFDGSVADFLRQNLVSGFDRSGITGAFRFRDGRFCVIQTERDVVAALRDAVLTAEAAMAEN